MLNFISDALTLSDSFFRPAFFGSVPSYSYVFARVSSVTVSICCSFIWPNTAVIDRPCYPGIYKVEPSEWAALNISVKGRMHAGRPLGFPCYTSYNGTSKTPDTAACAEVMMKQTYGTFVATKYGGYQQVQQDPLSWFEFLLTG